MLTDKDIKELLEFNAPNPILSIYLNTDPTQGNADTQKLRLRNLVKNIQLTEDVQAVENFFSQRHDWKGRGVAVFSCAAQGFFRSYSVAVPLPNLAHIGNRPSVKPLADLLDNYGGYGVVLVDKQGARLFHFHLGVLQEQEGIFGEEVKHTKSGGASAVPGRRGGTAGQTRYADEVVDRNLKEMVDFSVKFLEEKQVRRLLIGGTDDTVAQFRSLLPKAWQSLVLGTFPMSMTASHTEVINKALQIGREVEQQKEARLMQDLLTAAAKMTGGVLGLDATLSAVNENRVSTLILLEGYQKPGYRCPGCNALSVKSTEQCSHCGGAIERVQDVIEQAVSAVLRSGGEVEVVHDNRELEKIGLIGALLRF